MSSQDLPIGLDLMGGDGAPLSNIEGCIMALEKGVAITAFGSEEAISQLRADLGRKSAGAGGADGSDAASLGRLTTVVCRENISPNEHPLLAIREKEDSTIRRGILAVKEGQIGAFVSAGSTGALVAGGVVLLGRAEGVDKPCLAQVIPSKKQRGVLFLDLGASADARPQTLVQFAVMGDVYAQRVLGWESPSVSLLNIGVEPEKGSMSARKAFALLKEAPVRFVGNVEARDIFSGVSDIVVTDGFTGNVFLKTCEGTAFFMLDALKKELTASLFRKVAAACLKSAFAGVKELLDYSAYGGAPLLGLAGGIVKCHGASGPTAIANGVMQAVRFVRHHVSQVIVETLRQLKVEGE